MLVLCLPTPALGSVVERCVTAAEAYLGALDSHQLDRTSALFDTPERSEWTYLTGSKSRKHGLAMGDMSDRQRVLAHRLIACGLSPQGYQKSAGIMRMDDLVREYIGEIAFEVTGPIEIGKEFYWLAVFGTPGNQGPWSWQLEGHHLGLNFTVVDGSMSVTPAFMGADPAEVQQGPLAGWRLLGGEEDRAFALLASLDDEQRGQAVLSATVPRGIFTKPGRGDALQEFAGLSAASMTGPQRQLLWLLIGEYVQNLDPVMADRIIGEILQDGLDSLYFAWMGPTLPGSAIYYRIHGPAILIEFDHAANIRSRKLEPDPNHIHSIMRIPGQDFGDDLLRRHYEESPDHCSAQGDICGDGQSPENITD